MLDILASAMFMISTDQIDMTIELRYPVVVVPPHKISQYPYRIVRFNSPVPEFHHVLEAEYGPSLIDDYVIMIKKLM